MRRNTTSSGIWRSRSTAVWASAPYFHNGSVPTVWGVLKSSARPLFWRRMSKPEQPGVVMGYETDLARAYDPATLGWRYDDLPCGSSGVTPYLECDPADPYNTPLVLAWLDILFSHGSLAWNYLSPLLAPTFTNAQIEDRKIYNTRMHSQSNSGHEFTDVLTDKERTALIEYLKTAVSALAVRRRWLSSLHGARLLRDGRRRHRLVPARHGHLVRRCRLDDGPMRRSNRSHSGERTSRRRDRRLGTRRRD